MAVISDDGTSNVCTIRVKIFRQGSDARCKFSHKIYDYWFQRKIDILTDIHSFKSCYSNEIVNNERCVSYYACTTYPSTFFNIDQDGQIAVLNSRCLAQLWTLTLFRPLHRSGYQTNRPTGASRCQPKETTSRWFISTETCYAHTERFALKDDECLFHLTHKLKIYLSLALHAGLMISHFSSSVAPSKCVYPHSSWSKHGRARLNQIKLPSATSHAKIWTTKHCDNKCDAVLNKWFLTLRYREQGRFRRPQ